MIKQLFIVLAMIGVAWLLYPFLSEFFVPENVNTLAKDYIQGSVNDLNMPNVVTAVVVTYRGLDTLGEVTVLFLATAGVGFLLRKRESSSKKRRQGSEILQIGATILTPLIVMFGIYIFIHGHLTPGGGFQGGVVIASAMLLLSLAYTNFHFSHTLIHWLESISGVAYVTLGLLGLLLLGVDSFLDPRYLPLGRYLHLFSVGAVPLIYSAIGIKVGSELSSVIDSLRGKGDEA